MTLSPEFEKLVNNKLQAGEYRSADEVINAALRLFKEREDDLAFVQRVSAGEALPADERFQERLEILLQEAEDSGPPSEMTGQDWNDIRREGFSGFASPFPAHECMTRAAASRSRQEERARTGRRP